MAKRKVAIQNLGEARSQVYGYPKEFKKNVRQELNTKGFPIVKTNITKRIPISNKKKGTHAKTGASVTKRALKGGSNQIGFYATFNKKYWYLKFPNLGIGQSRKRAPIHFLERGADDSKRSIQKIVNTAIKNSRLK